MTEESPVNPLPPLVLLVFVGLVAIEIALNLAQAQVIGGPRGVGWRVALIDHTAFVPQVLKLIWQGRGTPDLWMRFISYPSVHYTFVSAAFAMAIWLAMGKFVGELFSTIGLIVIVATGVIGGALVYGMVGLWTGNAAPLIGSYPAVYALIGAYTYVMWLRLRHVQENELRAFSLIGMLLGIQLVFGALFGADPRWVADLAAFVFGGLASVLMAPGGWAGLLARLRRS